MNITTDNNIKEIHVREILQMFYPEEYKNIYMKLYSKGNFIYLEYKNNIYKEEIKISEKNTTKRLVYKVLKEETKKSFPYGVLTGVKPINILNMYKDKSKEEIIHILKKYYFVRENKIKLLIKTKQTQKELINDDLASLYIHIPFCPKRCSYCSFPSTILKEENSILTDYTKCLIEEIKSISNILDKTQTKLDSIYIGGGTPGILNEYNLKMLMGSINKYINTDIEFTFELGRADLVRDEKLKILKENNVKRICLNPQSFNEDVLNLCNRGIKKEEFFKSFELIKKYDFITNCDLIIGLNKEDIISFFDEVKTLVDLNADNITIHTLALKRASELEHIKFENENFYSIQKKCFDLLEENKYNPYYLYKQKQSLCMGENVGFAKKGKECIYNIKTMKNKSSVIALGAGGAGKVYVKNEDKTYRVDTTKDTNIYIKEISEIIKRKENEYISLLKK